MTIRYNLVPNGSFEYSAAGWSASAQASLTVAGATINGTTSSAPVGGGTGTKSLVVSTTAAAAGQGVWTELAQQVPAGTQITVSAYILGQSGASPLRIIARDVANSVTVQSSTVAADGGWKRASVTLTVGALAATVRVAVVNSTAVAMSFYVDGVMAETGTALNAYMDGDTASTATTIRTWAGTPGSSMSVEWQPVAAVAAAMTPAPSVRITVTDLPSIVGYVLIYRGDGKTEARVAGDSDQVPAGGVLLTDYRVPLGRTIAYRIEVYSSAGVLIGTINTGGTTAPVPADCSLAWIMDPENPRGAMLLPLMDPTDSRVQRSSDGVSVPMLSSPSRYLGAPKNRRSRVWSVETETADQAFAFEDMTSRGGVLLIRPSTHLRHATGLIYTGGPTDEEVPRHPYEGPSTWTWTAEEVGEPMWVGIVAENTWGDVKTRFATWADVKAQRASWLAVKQG